MMGKGNGDNLHRFLREHEELLTFRFSRRGAWSVTGCEGKCDEVQTAQVRLTIRPVTITCG
jgi:hypothetical protein